MQQTCRHRSLVGSHVETQQTENIRLCYMALIMTDIFCPIPFSGGHRKNKGTHHPGAECCRGPSVYPNEPNSGLNDRQDPWQQGNRKERHSVSWLARYECNKLVVLLPGWLLIPSSSTSRTIAAWGCTRTNGEYGVVFVCVMQVDRRWGPSAPSCARTRTRCPGNTTSA